jgi:2-haloalkanoic acid dehalogenase type II
LTAAFRVRFVSFDCYGTLVDWTGGVASAIGSLLARRGRLDLDPLRLVAEWERDQRLLLDPPYRRYADVLASSLRATFARRGIDLAGDEAREFADSMGGWPPFPEVPEALARAAALRPLVIVSNTDRATLDRTIAALGAPIHRAFTAEESGRYKPDPEALRFAVRALGAEPAEILHVSAYDEYDFRPAARLGMRTLAVRRPGAPDPPLAATDFVVSSLADLPGILARIGG